MLCVHTYTFFSFSSMIACCFSMRNAGCSYAHLFLSLPPSLSLSLSLPPSPCHQVASSCHHALSSILPSSLSVIAAASGLVGGGSEVELVVAVLWLSLSFSLLLSTPATKKYSTNRFFALIFQHLTSASVLSSTIAFVSP